jgi:predicted GNAT family N-acyltransferase
MSELDIQCVPLEAIISLRHAILRPDHDISHFYFDGDDEANTKHFAAILSQQIVGVASIYDHAPINSASPKNQWQLRGMAIAQTHQRQGIGKQLLNAIIKYMEQQHPDSLLWCNAREHAIDFYAMMGFEIHGEAFMIPDVGMHYRAHKQIASKTKDVNSGYS